MFPVNPLANILSGFTRKRKVFGDTEPLDNINPDNIDFSSANSQFSEQPQGGHPVLANILQAIASGVGIGFSQDPAQALMQQLAQQRQQAMKQAEIAADNRRQQVQVDSQRELEKLRIEGQKGIVGLEQKGRKELQTTDIAAQKALKLLGFANEKDMQQSQIKAEQQRIKMQQDFEMDRLYTNSDLAKELEDLKNAGDIKQVQSKTLMASLFHAMQNSRYVKGAPIPPSAVIDITDKVGKGIPLTKEDTDIIDRAFKASSAANSVASRISGGSGGGIRTSANADTKLLRQDQLDWEKGRRDMVQKTMDNFKVPLTDDAGNVVKDTNGNVQLVQGLGKIDETGRSELSKRIDDVLKIHDRVNPQPYSIKTNPPPDGKDSIIRNIDALNAQIDKLSSQYSPVEINKMIDLDNTLNAAEKRQAKARASQRKQSGSWNKFIGQ